MKRYLFAASILIIMQSCASTSKKVSVLQTRTPLPTGTIVEVIGSGAKVPENAVLLGNVRIGDASTKTKNCTYSKVVADAQEQARGMGGNLIQIVQHKEPDWTSTCHRIKCDVYFVKQ